MLACGQVLDARVVHVGIRGAGGHVEAQHEVVSPAENVEHQARPRAVEVSHDEESSQDDDETGLSEMPTACLPSASAGSVTWCHNLVNFDLERGAAPGERRTEDRLAVKLGHRSRRAGRVWVCYAGCFALALGLDGPSGFLCVLQSWIMG